MERQLQKGTHVIFFDEHRRVHNALVTEVHSGGLSYTEQLSAWGHPACVNLLFVTADERKTDQYGAQSEHRGSVAYGTPAMRTAGGYFYLFPDEV